MMEWAAGAWSWMFGVDAPSTHQRSSGPICLTNTVVTGPPTRVRTSTSPERAAPGRNPPSSGCLNPTKWTANPRAAATASAYRVVLATYGHTAMAGSAGAGAVVGLGAVVVGVGVEPDDP